MNNRIRLTKKVIGQAIIDCVIGDSVYKMYIPELADVLAAEQPKGEDNEDEEGFQRGVD